MRTQQTLVERFRARLATGNWARLHCFVLVGLSAAAAFLVSAALLAAGVRWMGIRYAVAAAAGYAVFLLLIRTWVRWKWSRLVPDADLDLSNIDPTDIIRMPSRAAKAIGDGLYGGGQSGGGGASMMVDSPGQANLSVPAHASGGGGGGFSLDIDGDDLFWVIVVLCAFTAGAVAIAYVVYIAPTLLAEAAVNAAVAGKVYHGLQRRDSRHWTSDVLRKTAVAALIVIVSAWAFGYAAQRIAPEARSVRGVWHHLHRTNA